jgi:hypothetical protein
MRRLIVAFLLVFAGPAVAQPVVQCKINGAFAPCPTGSIPAPKIAGGTVSDVVFGYLAGVTSSIQAQLNAIVTAAITLSSSTPANVSASAGSVGVGGTAARSDHVHYVGTELSGLSGLATTGIVCRTGSGTYSPRTLTAPAAGITVSNGDGVSGNPTLALANDLAAIEALASTGIPVRSASDTWVQRSVASGTGTTVTNGNGVSGNIAVNVTYGTGSNTATQGNDTRLPPAPGTAGSGLYDNGSAWTRLALGTSGQTYVAGAGGAPQWDSRPAVIVAGSSVGALSSGVSYLVGRGGGLATASNSGFLSIGTRSGMRAKNLYCTGSSLVAGSNIVIAMYTGAGASTLTCTITEPAVTCNNTTNNPAVSAGNGVNIQVTSSAIQGAGYGLTCAFEIAIGVG